MTAPTCPARHNTFSGWGGCYPKCALPAGHTGAHSTSYGLKFDDKGETVHDRNS